MDELTQLLLTASDGDRQALTELVQRAQPDVWRFCAAIVGAERADDATQDTFIRAWRGAHAFEGRSSAKTWLFAIAKRVCFEAVRRQQLTPTPVADLPETVGEGHEGLVDGQDLLTRLEPDRRAAFVLTQLFGLSYDDAAVVCGCPVGTIRSRIARARAELFALAQDPSARRGQTRGGSGRAAQPG
jgi:RNA polymerase sigma-70 factor, ECF subfamily